MERNLRSVELVEPPDMIVEREEGREGERGEGRGEREEGRGKRLDRE